MFWKLIKLESPTDEGSSNLETYRLCYPPWARRDTGRRSEREGGCILTFKVLLLGAADFMCCGFAHSLADRRAGHAVLCCCDTIRDGLARHCFGFSLKRFRANWRICQGWYPSWAEFKWQRVVEVCDQSTAPFVCSSFFFSVLNSGCKKIIYCAVTWAVRADHWRYKNRDTRKNTIKMWFAVFPLTSKSQELFSTTYLRTYLPTYLGKQTALIRASLC